MQQFRGDSRLNGLPPVVMNRAALDLAYAPGGTRWVRTLRAAGVRAEDGREVLVHQGGAAFERFFPDQVAPLEVMRAAVHRALGA